jgi:16S rRNA (cytosine1402-N4)-methyltransferase
MQLSDIIKEALDFIPKDSRKEEIKRTCQRCFQALRIEVNNEFEVLEKFLDKIPEALVPGGKVAVLSFHSGEDRRVKKAFKYFLREEIFEEISKDPVRAGEEEFNSNPRSRSAKLRCAIKSK